MLYIYICIFMFFTSSWRGLKSSWTGRWGAGVKIPGLGRILRLELFRCCGVFFFWDQYPITCHVFVNPMKQWNVCLKCYWNLNNNQRLYNTVGLKESGEEICLGIVICRKITRCKMQEKFTGTVYFINVIILDSCFNTWYAEVTKNCKLHFNGY